MNPRRDALRRIGGGSSVSWFAFWVTLALNAVHHVSGSPGLSGNAALRITAVLASQLAMFAVLLAARATVLSDADTDPRPAATLLTFAVAGASKSLVLMAVLTQMIEVPVFLVVGSMITGTFTFTAYLALCSYLVSVFGENRRRVMKAAQAQAELVAARAQAQQVLHDQRKETVEVVQSDLMAAFDAMAASSSAIDAEQMRVFLDQTVRPTSHRLAARIDRWRPPQIEAVDPRLRWSRLYDAVGVSRPFAPVVQACLCSTPAFSTIIAIGPGRFLLLLAAAVLAPFTALTVGNRVIERLPAATSPRARIAAVLGWVAVTALFVALTWGACLAGTGLGRAGFIYGVFITVTLSVATVAAKAALTAQQQLQHELEMAQTELRWDLARVHQLQWHQQRLAARALHGPVQSALIRETVRLTKNSDKASADYLRDSLTCALRSAFDDADTVPDLLSILATLTRSWQPLCHVAYEVDCSLTVIDADDSARSCLADLLRETVANAVRHGSASQVAIRVEQQSARTLSVEAVDDGLGNADETGSGLGAQIMDDCCVSWTRRTGGAGTTVRCLMPFSAGQGAFDDELADTRR